MDKNLEISKKIYIFAQKDNVMGNIRTTAQLQELFQRSRQRKQQEREEQKKLKTLKYKELCKQADELLRKADGEAKRAKMEELQALARQTPQRALKQPLQPQGTPFYGSSLIEDNLFDYVTVYSRDEIQAMEETEGGRINWDKWDEVVNSTRQSIRDMGINLPVYKQPTQRKDRRNCVTYVYDLQETLLGVFETARKAEDTFGIRRNTIGYYKFMHKPYKGLIFTDTPK